MSINKLVLTVAGLLPVILLAATPVPAQAPQPHTGLAFVPGEILVKFRPTTGVAAGEAVLQTAGMIPVEVSAYSGVMRVKVAPGTEADVAARLAARGDVLFAQVNHILAAFGSPNDTNFSLQWGLHNVGQTGGTADADIDAPEGWDIHTGAGSIVVAITDTGIDLDHPDLQPNLWANPGEIAGNGLDDDGNGFIDDVNGWDFCTSPYNSSFVRCTSPQDNNPNDEHSHGSHVAGIAAARGNNGTGIAGVSWGATLMPVKVLDQFQFGTDNSVANGINYAVANGAKIINLSLGALPPGGATCEQTFPAMSNAIKDAHRAGVLVVAASGNNYLNRLACPALQAEAMAVGATTFADQRAGYSNYGAGLEVVAPGGSGGTPNADDIYSTLPGGSYGYKAGTSMATPHTSGLAALVWSYSPGLYRQDVRSIIQLTADDLGPAGWDQTFGYGRINAYRGLQALVSLQTTPAQLNFVVDDTSGPTPATDNVQILSADSQAVTWTATISPAVSWLGLSSAGNGTISAASSPEDVWLTPARPSTYGVYSTTVVITGTNTLNQPLGTRTTTVYLNYVAKLQNQYLPLILKNVAFAPDLTIENLIATGAAVTVTLKNRGNAAVSDAFWVDVYFNPSETPALNRPWDDIAAAGAVWGVTTPIAAGSTLTLTTGDAYYSETYSSSPPWPVGVPVYGLVDSINYDTSYGAVPESNENNNLYGPVISTAGSAAAAGVIRGQNRPSIEEGAPAR